MKRAIKPMQKSLSGYEEDIQMRARLILIPTPSFHPLNSNSLLQNLVHKPRDATSISLCIQPLLSNKTLEISPTLFLNATPTSITTMVVELGLSLTQHEKLADQHSNPGSITSSWMWNPRRAEEDDDSWEVRAFAEDTGNVMGTTWPPRSYTCTFCRREFRSAQALGGHMNVHRRDRAKLRQSSLGFDPSSSSASSPSLIFPTQEFVTTSGLCLLYPFLAPSAVFTPMPVNGCLDSPSTLLSISPYMANNMISSRSPSPSIDLPMTTGINTSLCNLGNTETLVPVDGGDEDNDDENNDNKKSTELGVEEIDLELRLGQRPSPR